MFITSVAYHDRETAPRTHRPAQPRLPMLGTIVASSVCACLAKDQCLQRNETTRAAKLQVIGGAPDETIG
jgi:hypothetical protein